MADESSRVSLDLTRLACYASPRRDQFLDVYDTVHIKPEPSTTPTKPVDPKPRAGTLRRQSEPRTNIKVEQKITFKRQSHKTRSQPSRVGWFVGRDLSSIGSPPDAFFENRIEGDLFINHADENGQFQVWIFEACGMWARVQWGHRKEDRLLIIHPDGTPSLVVESTFNKRYNNGESNCVI